MLTAFRLPESRYALYTRDGVWGYLDLLEIDRSAYVAEAARIVEDNPADRIVELRDIITGETIARFDKEG